MNWISVTDIQSRPGHAHDMREVVGDFYYKEALI